MKGADITAITKTADGTWQATDMHAIGFERPLRDTQQDVVLLSAQSTANGTTVAVFRRPLVSCDSLNDLNIEDGMPQIVIWAIGQGPELSYHGEYCGWNLCGLTCIAWARFANAEGCCSAHRARPTAQVWLCSGGPS